MFYKKDDDYIRSLEKLVVIITYQNIFIIYCISLLSYHRGINAHCLSDLFLVFYTETCANFAQSRVYQTF